MYNILSKQIFYESKKFYYYQNALLINFILLQLILIQAEYFENLI